MIIFIILAIISFTIAIWQHRQKGYVFNNRYIFGSKEERMQRDWNDYYIQSRNTFALLGILNLSCIIFGFSDEGLSVHPVHIIIIVITILYVIISSWKLMEKHGI